LFSLGVAETFPLKAHWIFEVNLFPRALCDCERAHHAPHITGSLQDHMAIT